jgi:hypothetical protein
VILNRDAEGDICTEDGGGVGSKYWENLHYYQLSDLYFTQNIRRIKPREMGWTGHVARI